MKNRKALLLVLLTCMVMLLGGCSSISMMVRSNLEGVPSWVIDPSVSASQVAFVGEGVSATSSDARLLAYEDILSQLSKYIGEDVAKQYYRELSTTDSVAALRLRITQEFEKRNNDGQYVVFLMATVNADTLKQARTVAYNAMLERQDKIAAILAKADLAYRHNKDMEAISLYIDAAIIASEGYIEHSSYQFPKLMKRIESYVGALKIYLTKIDTTIPTCTVSVKRKSQLLPPRVFDASVFARFEARNGMGEAYVDQLLFNSASAGSFQFIPANPGMLAKGELTFYIDLADEIQRLEFAAGEEAVAELKALVEKSEVGFSYARVSPIAQGGVLVDIMEFTMQGALRDSMISTNMLIEEYKLDDLYFLPVYSTELDEEDFYHQIRVLYPNQRYLIYGKAGVSDIIPMGDGQMVMVNGAAQLVQLSNLAVLSETKEIRLAVWGKDLQTATDEAFRRFGLVASSMLDSALY